MAERRAMERSDRDAPMSSKPPLSPRPDGLEAVYLERREALVRFVRARGAGDHAEDVVQELWLKLSAGSLAPIADPVGYLYRAANNLMISRYRSAQRSERREEEYTLAGPDEDRSGEEALAARQEIERAETRLRALGERVLHIFVLFRVEGMPQRDIAARLGLSLSAVEKNLQRAYRAIADLRESNDAV